MDSLLVGGSYLASAFMLRTLYQIFLVYIDFGGFYPQHYISWWMTFVTVTCAGLAYAVSFMILKTRSWLVSALVSAVTAAAMALTAARWDILTREDVFGFALHVFIEWLFIGTICCLIAKRVADARSPKAVPNR